MASEYAYITLAKLENFTGLDYSTIDSVRFADAKVEATISLAEKVITSYLGADAALTVSDGIEVATTIVSAKFMHNKMVVLGYTEPENNMDLINMSVVNILKTFLNPDEDVSVDSIPMSGANNTIDGNALY